MNITAGVRVGLWRRGKGRGWEVGRARGRGRRREGGEGKERERGRGGEAGRARRGEAGERRGRGGGEREGESLQTALACRSHVCSPSRSSPAQVHMSLEARPCPGFWFEARRLVVLGLRRRAATLQKQHGSVHTLPVPTDPRGQPQSRHSLHGRSSFGVLCMMRVSQASGLTSLHA